MHNINIKYYYYYSIQWCNLDFCSEDLIGHVNVTKMTIFKRMQGIWGTNISVAVQGERSWWQSSNHIEEEWPSSHQKAKCWRKGEEENGPFREVTASKELFDYWLQLLEQFPYHSFLAKWQQEQLDSLLENLLKDHAVCIHDYSEGYVKMKFSPNTLTSIKPACNHSLQGFKRGGEWSSEQKRSQ